tara:strand:- start:312 stop:431 length:120 start_codon:yes stop_codon:yes gene_type:complete
MSMFMAKKKENPMTLLDFIILVSPITILGVVGLIAYLLK